MFGFLAVFAACPARAGDVTSTRTSGFPTDWSALSRWDHDVPGVGTFPNNGNEGHTFDVILPNNLVDLDQAITIDSLGSLFTIRLNGFSLDVLGSVDVSFGEFIGGTVTAENAFASTNITLDSTAAQFDSVALSGNANIVLRNGSALDLDGILLFDGDGDVTSLGEPTTQIDLSGAGIVKTGGTGSTDFAVPIVASDLTIRHDTASASLRFLDFPLSLPSLSVESEGVVEFAVPLELGDVSATLGESGEIVLRQGTILNGTLSTVPAGKRLGNPGVRLDANFGAASLSGGTLNCDAGASFCVDGGAVIGGAAEVVNIGEIRFADGEVGPGGLVNRGLLRTFNDSPPGVLVTGTLRNEGDLKLFDTATVADGGVIENAAGGECVLDSGIEPAVGADPAATLFRSAGDLQTLVSLSPSLTLISTTAEISGLVTVHFNNPLWITQLAELADAVVTINLGSMLAIEAAPGAGPHISGIVCVTGDDPEGRFQLFSGDFVMDGTITDAAAGSAKVVMSGGTLSGGNLDLTRTNEGFGHIGGTAGQTDPVTNLGTYTLTDNGTLGPAGLVNEGTLRIMPNATGEVAIQNLTNNSMVDQVSEGLLMSSPGIINNGTWKLPNASPTPAVSYPTGNTIGVFINNGTLCATGTPPATGVVGIDVDVTTPGTVIADGSKILFSRGVAQYDQTTSTLTGGAFEVRNGGAIFILDQTQFTVIRSLAALRFSEVTSEGAAPFEALSQLGGGLALSGGSVLDVRANDDFGGLELDSNSEVFAGEAVLRPAGGPAPDSRLIATTITNRGRLAVADNGVIQTDTEITLLDGGVVAGALGSIQTPLVRNTSGLIEPGLSPLPNAPEGGPSLSVGVLSIEGGYQQDADGTLRVELSSAGLADLLDVTGAAALAGSVELVIETGFAPADGSVFTIVAAASCTGMFDTLDAPCNYSLEYTPTEVRLAYSAGPCPCNDADIAPPFGQLDLGDIAAFSSGFLTQDPIADLDGNGVYDLRDIAIFVGGFQAGCP